MNVTVTLAKTEVNVLMTSTITGVFVLMGTRVSTVRMQQMVVEVRGTFVELLYLF